MNIQRGKRIVHALLLMGLCPLLWSCPDTTVPSIFAEGNRVCSQDELDAFRELSTANERYDLWIAFVDVGQGDATWIRTPGTRDLDAKEIIVDSGNCRIQDGSCGFDSQVNDSYDSDGVGALITFMRENGWTENNPIDYLVATHPDKDHYGGTWALLREYRVDAFVESGYPNENKTYHVALDAVRAEGATLLSPVTVTGLNSARSGEMNTESWGRNVEVSLLSADLSARQDNNSSVVLMVEYLGVKILLTGDAEDPLDERLIELDDRQPGRLKANVLKAGHHAGNGTNSQAFLDRVFPSSLESTRQRYAIISAGMRDQLPHPETLDRITSSVGPRGVYRTDRRDAEAGKNMATSPGDDHILMRVSAEGDLTVCYAYPSLD